MNLRQSCRQQRNQLTPREQFEHARLATARLLRSPWLQRPKRIAVYLSQDGELSTELLTHQLWKSHHHVYLPVLKTLRGRHMAFARYTPDTPMAPNRFGILEPDIPNHQHLTGNQLDVVLMPLTCFDEQGHRIGMGGGFYDRTFQFKRWLPSAHSRPKLIGWAHECQKVESIPSEPWDLPLEGLVSEKHLYRFR
jgi:5,10-methenyltetrahydrofolate synthetase